MTLKKEGLKDLTLPKEGKLMEIEMYNLETRRRKNSEHRAKCTSSQ